MPLVIGASLGPYQILAPLGAGGMGEVYRARDTKLQRDVALKILPELFALDPERLARFKREAQVLASLNHSNIGAIYGLEEQGGVLALVLELVEGPTLAERIAEGPMPFHEVRPIARQIAEALEAAHEHGVIHRDLKPSNIKLRPDGTVKVLDFGLAKALDPMGSGPNVSQSPTITSPAATRAGVILGTAAYMSPEQARGRAVDKRADIWAFGAVLFEMLTGVRAFGGEEITDTLGAVIHKEASLQALPASTPPAVVDLVRRCLKKDPRERLRDIGDARIALDEALIPPSAPAATPSGRSAWSVRLGWIAAAVVAIATLPFVAAHLREAPTPAPLFRFTITPPELSSFAGGTAYAPGAAVSPDGRFIAFMATRNSGGAAAVWLRALDAADSRPLPGTESSSFPFWSPDSRYLAFFSGGKLKKIDITGGPAVTLCDAPAGEGGTWNRDGIIVFAPTGNGGLVRVSAAGGQPAAVTKLDEARKETSHRWPSFLPDGRRFVFIAEPGNAVSIGSIDSSEVRLLFNADSRAEYVPPGYLLFVRQATLMARAFDSARAEPAGEPMPVAEQLRSNSSVGRAAFSASAAMLVYRTADASTGTPVWVDRSGRELSPIVSGPLASADFPRLSPDGRRLTLVINGDVWVYDLEGRPPIKLTFDGDHFAPLWTPDGRRIVFESNSPAPLKSLPADGSGGAPELMSPVGHFHPHGWIDNGRQLLAVAVDRPTTGNDIVQWTPGSASEPQVVVQTPAAEGILGTSLSPDGRWLAYTSDSTGQTEIWVRPYPGPGAAVRVSPNTGAEPIWAWNGRELYYLEGAKLMAVAVDARGDFTFKPPVQLFDTGVARGGSQPPSYDVAADGRFLMIKPANPRNTATPLTVIANWTEKLRPAAR